MPRSDLWGFDGQKEFDEWVAHCRRLIRRSLRNYERGVREDDVDDVLQDLMHRYATGSPGNADFLERQYSIAEALVKYVIADFWRRKKRERVITVDSELVGWYGLYYATPAGPAERGYEILEPVLPHLTVRQRQFLEYVLETGCDIQDVHGDRAKALESFGMTEGAYRAMMKRIADRVSDHATGEVFVPVGAGPTLPTVAGPLDDESFERMIVSALHWAVPGFYIFIHFHHVILEEFLFFEWRKTIKAK